MVLELSTTVEFQKIQYQKQNDLYVMASLKAPQHESEERQSRAPIDIVCVIDKSGSMVGSKMDLVRKTLSFMVEQLKDEDQLSLITFDSLVYTDITLTKMSNEGKKQAQLIISQLKTGTTTNLSGGLFEGLEILKKRTEPRDVASILLFTDGLANNGLTKTDKIVSGVERYQQQMGKAVSVFTFGFGTDHDANMLRSIAEAGNGLYYYLEREDEIPQLFADCLGGLMSITAQNIKLKIEVLEGVSLKAIHSKYKRNVETKEFVEINIGDLYSEEQRDIVLEVIVPTVKEPQEQKIVKFTLAYFDIINTSPVEIEAFSVIERTEREPENLQPNMQLDKQRNRVESTDAMAKGREFADKGDLKNARAVSI
jgi:Mg-chelatase subunit ChlD